MELMRQQDMPSLTRNGNFQSGLAHWLFSDGVTHVRSATDSSGSANLLGAPLYLADVPAGGEIRQVISRSDVYAYPSRRWVEQVTAVPIGINTLGLIENTGRIDGRTPTDEDHVFDFQELNSFGEVVKTVPMKKGIQVEVVDRHRNYLSGPYRVGRLVETDLTPQSRYLHVSPIDTEIVRMATQDDYSGAVYTSEVEPNGQLTGTIEITGTLKFDRKEEGIFLGTGFKLLDVIVVEQPEFAVCRIVGITQTQNGYSLQVRPVLPGIQFLPEGDAVPMEKWFVTAITEMNLIRELPVFSYDYTLAFSYDSQTDYGGTPSMRIVDRAFKTVKTIPLSLLENNDYFEDLTLSPQLQSTRYRRRLYRFFLESSKPITGRLVLTIPGGSNGAQIGDVVLHKGNYTRRHDYDDRDDPSVSLRADSRSALDRLYGGVDHLGGVLPRGTVVLYAGGPVCPPGYKRVDSLPRSAQDGFETLPAPDVVSYDADRNRTILIWDDQTFDLLDEEGNTIPIKGEAQTVQVSLPPQAPFNGAFEQLRIGPVHQRIQPGMSLRVKTSDVETPTNDLFDYSVPIRAAFVNRQEIAGPYVDPEAPRFTNNYPIYIDGADLDPSEQNFEQIGPDRTQQPTSYSLATTPGFSLTPFNVTGTQANPGTFSGLRDGDATMTITATLAPLAAGETVYVRWTTVPTLGGLLGGGPQQIYSGAFIATILSNNNGTIVVERKDGNGMVVDGTTASVGGTAYFTDAKEFDPSVLVTRSVVGSGIVFSARRFAGSFVMTTFGDLTFDVLNFNEELTVEPSGMIRYADPGFDYGGMGHSHEVKQGDASFTDRIAPHVNQTLESQINSTVVARKHGHGFFPKYVFPIPEFRAYLLCEKL